jgi:hypothetical protein
VTEAHEEVIRSGPPDGDALLRDAVVLMEVVKHRGRGHRRTRASSASNKRPPPPVGLECAEPRQAGAEASWPSSLATLMAPPPASAENKTARKTRNSLARSLMAQLELDSFYNEPACFITS